MNHLKMISRLLVGFLLGFFITYWVLFVTYTIMLFISGGRDEVIHWYMHLSAVGFQLHWSWRAFVAGQLANLAITAGLYFLWRRLRPEPEQTQ